MNINKLILNELEILYKFKKLIIGNQQENDIANE